METVTRVVLVGFMAAGKSEVGRRVAQALGWSLADVDDELVRREGRSIPEIFEEDGEAGFRVLERALMDELLDLEGAVLVPGGGWAAWTGAEGELPPPLARMREGTLTVWLKVGPETAVGRARDQREKDGVVRPLLEGGAGAVEAAGSLLRRREPSYALADLHLDTEGLTPVEIAATIVHRVRGTAPHADPER